MSNSWRKPNQRQSRQASDARCGARQSRGSTERARERVFARALKLLTARPRSEALLRERLLEKSWAEPEIVDECIARLKEAGLIDDNQFALAYASWRTSTRPIGRLRLARELLSKKVAAGAIEKALDSVFEQTSEEELIDRAIEKRIRAQGRPVDPCSAKRMFDHLARLGFEYDLIVRKLRALKVSWVDEGDSGD
jgi:regulatory protein